MRGQKLFNDVVKTESADKLPRKGRNDELLDIRNKCMIARYYYYGYLRGKRFDDILDAMVSEFFLTPARISRIVQQNIDAVRDMKGREVSLYQLQTAWPQFKW